jgi:hypothetical protein
MRLLRQALEKRADENAEAARVLAGLRAAVDELSDLLKHDVREAELQTCLTNNSLLFGTQYRQVKPKHRLGDQFELDTHLYGLAARSISLRLSAVQTSYTTTAEIQARSSFMRSSRCSTGSHGSISIARTRVNTYPGWSGPWDTLS